MFQLTPVKSRGNRSRRNSLKFTLPSFVRSYLRKMVVASSRDRMTPRLASVLRKLSTVMPFSGRPKSRKPVFSSVDPGATRSFSFKRSSA